MLSPISHCCGRSLQGSQGGISHSCFAPRSTCQTPHSPSLCFTGDGWDLGVSSLISLCKVFYFSWHSQSSGLEVFMT